MRKKKVTNYPEVHKWQIAHIKQGLRQAEAGEFAKQPEVSSAFARWRKNRKKPA